MPAFTITETLSMDDEAEGYYLHFSDKFIMGGGLGVKGLVRLKATWPSLLNLDSPHAKTNIEVWPITRRYYISRPII